MNVGRDSNRSKESRKKWMNSQGNKKNICHAGCHSVDLFFSNPEKYIQEWNPFTLKHILCIVDMNWDMAKYLSLKKKYICIYIYTYVHIHTSFLGPQTKCIKYQEVILAWIDCFVDLEVVLGLFYGGVHSNNRFVWLCPLEKANHDTYSTSVTSEQLTQNKQTNIHLKDYDYGSFHL